MLASGKLVQQTSFKKYHLIRNIFPVAASLEKSKTFLILLLSFFLFFLRQLQNMQNSDHKTMAARADLLILMWEGSGEIPLQSNESYTWQLAVGSWQLTVGSWQLAVGIGVKFSNA